MADLLIERGAVLDIFDACAAGRLERARSLLEANPSLVKGFAADGFQALGLAAFFGHPELVRFLGRLSTDMRVTNSTRQMREYCSLC